jgi:hypothetical protein
MLVEGAEMRLRIREIEQKTEKVRARESKSERKRERQT